MKLDPRVEVRTVTTNDLEAGRICYVEGRQLFLSGGWAIFGQVFIGTVTEEGGKVSYYQRHKVLVEV